MRICISIVLLLTTCVPAALAAKGKLAHGAFARSAGPRLAPFELRTNSFGSRTELGPSKPFGHTGFTKGDIFTDFGFSSSGITNTTEGKAKQFGDKFKSRENLTQHSGDSDPRKHKGTTPSLVEQQGLSRWGRSLSDRTRTAKQGFEETSLNLLSAKKKFEKEHLSRLSSGSFFSILADKQNTKSVKNTHLFQDQHQQRPHSYFSHDSRGADYSSRELFDNNSERLNRLMASNPQKYGKSKYMQLYADRLSRAEAHEGQTAFGTNSYFSTASRTRTSLFKKFDVQAAKVQGNRYRINLE